MCGIVGTISSTPVDKKIVTKMRDCMIHRGPDYGGLWLSADARVCLGHRRLAIVDLSPEANQPFVSNDARYVITFNGEIYNFRQLRKDLSVRGFGFRTRSDTEVLIEAYRCWGERCLERLSGMFAFAIWDCAERRLFCARDRVGEKPFYFAMVGETFIFSSELKALLLWPDFQRKIDYTALIDFLSFGFVPDPKSIWKDCYKLSPGHTMSVQIQPNGIPFIKGPVTYWDMEFDPDYSVKDWRPKILCSLENAAREMAFADVPVGSFLSGGVDSSSVTAALSRVGSQVTSFTVGFHESDYDERRWARQVARLYKKKHTEKVVSAEDLLPVFHTLVWHYDEPFNDYSYLPTYYLCREARKLITVALSGDGGDEIFAGYPKYQRLGLRQDVNRFIPPPLLHFIAAAVKMLTPEKGPFRKKVLSYEMDVEDIMIDMLTTGLHVPVLQAVARGPLFDALKHYSPIDSIRPLMKKRPWQEVGLINLMRYLDLKLTLAGDILVKVDRASMAVSLEVRPVYLHRDLISLAEKIPPDLLADRNNSKKVLKSALEKWLPNSVLYRKKMGFALPLKRWIAGKPNNPFLAGKDQNPLEELLDMKMLRDMTSSHLSGNADWTSVMHSIFYLKRWFKTWMGPYPSSHVE